MPPCACRSPPPSWPCGWVTTGTPFPGSPPTSSGCRRPGWARRGGSSLVGCQRGSIPPAPRSGGPSGAACAGSGCKATSWTWTPPCSGATPYGPTAAPAATSGREGGAEPGGDGRHHRWWEEQERRPEYSYAYSTSIKK